MTKAEQVDENAAAPSAPSKPAASTSSSSSSSPLLSSSPSSNSSWVKVNEHEQQQQYDVVDDEDDDDKETTKKMMKFKKISEDVQDVGANNGKSTELPILHGQGDATTVKLPPSTSEEPALKDAVDVATSYVASVGIEAAARGVPSTASSAGEKIGTETTTATISIPALLSPPYHHQSRSSISSAKMEPRTAEEQETNRYEAAQKIKAGAGTGNDTVSTSQLQNTKTPPSMPRKPDPPASTPAPAPAPASTNFAQLAYRTIETYVSEAIHEARVVSSSAAASASAENHHFPPLQMLQVTGEGFARLTHSVQNTIGQHQQYYHNTISGGPGGGDDGNFIGGFTDRRPSKPIALRHIQSTPLQHKPSNLLDDEDEDEPPPIGLDILDRARSTPLSMSKNSAFVRSNSQLSQDLSLSRQGSLSLSRQGSNSSAFTALTPYPMKKASSRSTETEVKPVIFNPIKLHDDVADDHDLGEMTAIEIVNIPKPSEMEMEKSKSKVGGSPKQPSNPASQTMTAASKAAKKFFSDVRKLRVPKKVRSGRENPAQPPSVSDESSKGRGNAIRDDETLSSKSSAGNSIKPKIAHRKTSKMNNLLPPSIGKKDGNNQVIVASSGGDWKREQSIHRAVEGTDSPATVPSPVYQQLEDSPKARVNGDQVGIEVSNALDRLSLASSPEPGRSGRSGGASTPHSHDSPQTSRYSSNTSSSGQATHATLNSYSSGQGTNLSAISETDREVRALNIGAASRTKSSRSHEKDTETIDSDKTENIELSLASGRNVRFGDYVELVDTPSPVNPREGATVQADRFFTFNDQSEKRSLARLRSLPSVKRGGSSHSPTTISSASANTNSSTSTMSRDEPPIIVSYIDRKLDKKQVSDLTSLHRETQSSSPRSGMEGERRESSPGPCDQILVEDSQVVFEGAQSSLKDATAPPSNRPRPIWPAKGLQFGRKIRSLPPKSPHNKGLRGCATPPPRGGSPAAGVPSPPHQLLGPDADPNLLSSSHALASSSNVGSYTQILGESLATAIGDLGSHEVIRLSPTPAAFGPQSNDALNAAGTAAARSYYSIPRGSSPVGHGRATAYEENGIEILKTNSKEEVANASSSPVPLVTPDNASTSSSC